MARNGSGTFTILNTFVTLTAISSSATNGNNADIAAEITNSVAADGQTTITGALKGANGTNSAPSYGFASDTNTGMYRIGADNLGLTVGGTKIVDIASTGVTITGSLVASAADLDFIGLTSETAPAVDDTLPFYDLSATANRGMVISDLFKTINGLSADSAPDVTADYVVTYDASASAAKKVLVQNLATAPIAAGFKNLVIQNNSGTPNTKVDLTADAATVETSGGAAFRLRSVSVTVDCGTTGANGLDTGSLANSTWYAILVIYNPATQTAAGLMCTAANLASPTLPSGYTAYARFGWARTNGSALFHHFQQKGRRASYIVSGSGPTQFPPVVASGTAGTYSLTAPTYATASVSGVVPPTASMIYLTALSTYKAGVTANIQVAPNTSYKGADNSSGIIPPYDNRTVIHAPAFLVMMLESTDIAWASSAAGGAILCNGWEDNL